MRTWTGILLAGALATFVGCNKSEPGGPGATTHPTSTLDKIKSDIKGDDPNTFAFSEAYTSLSLKQGEKKELDITIKRGKEFKQGVKVKVDAPKGLKIDKPESQIKASDSETIKIFVEAEADATVGDHKIKITGTPDSGSATSYEQTVKVSAK